MINNIIANKKIEMKTLLNSVISCIFHHFQTELIIRIQMRLNNFVNEKALARDYHRE